MRARRYVKNRGKEGRKEEKLSERELKKNIRAREGEKRREPEAKGKEGENGREMKNGSGEREEERGSETDERGSICRGKGRQKGKCLYTYTR